MYLFFIGKIEKSAYKKYSNVCNNVYIYYLCIYMCRLNKYVKYRTEGFHSFTLIPQ